MKRFTFYLLTLLLLGACEKSIDWELQPEEESRLVVEAILTDQLVIQELFLSQTFPGINDTTPQVSDAIVQVEVNQVVYEFSSDPQVPGRYVSVTPFAVLSGFDYTLEIIWQEEVYSAVSRLSEVFPIPQPTFAPVAFTDSLTLGNFVPVFTPGQQAMYQIDINWEHLSSEEPNRARIYQYSFSSIDMSQLVPPPQEIVQFPRGSIVFIRKFGLNEDFAEYLRSKAIETEWSGTFFYSTPDNLPTNISNDGLGFFSTCAVLTRTVIAQ